MKTNYLIQELRPFGLEVQAKGNDLSIEMFPKDLIEQWIEKHQIIVFKGFQTLKKQAFALHAQQLGEPLQWPFGAINELIVKKKAENYIYTNSKVPLHWDGAFIKRVPYLILFQCIKAPKRESGGGTTFCNTSKVLSDAPEELKEKWRNIKIRYKTEKLVHYGGQIEQQLVDVHPVQQKEVLRFAEPVDDLNPVSLDIDKFDKEAQDLFITEMQKTLYDEKYLYTHLWEDGDIVIADNYTLLHGRDAFHGDQSRYIQRINLLNRPKMSLKRFLKNSFLIRRKEFFVAEIPILILPVLLSLTAWSNLLELPFLLGFSAVFLLFNIGDMINCYADYKLDAIYKSHLSNAVFELGKQNVMLQIILSGTLALILTGITAFLTQQYFLIPMTIIGAFIGLQYSIPPFQFKSRGILQFFCLWGIIFFGPMLYTSIITNGIPDLELLTFFALYGVHQMGIILFNTAEDYLEDLNDGLTTIVIRLGLHRSLKMAWVLIAVSGILLQLLMMNLFNQLQISNWQWAIGIYTIGWLVILWETLEILLKVKGMEEKETTDTLKKNGMKVPRWLKIGAYTVLAVTGIYVYAKLMG